MWDVGMWDAGNRNDHPPLSSSHIPIHPTSSDKRIASGTVAPLISGDDADPRGARCAEQRGHRSLSDGGDARLQRGRERRGGRQKSARTAPGAGTRHRGRLLRRRHLGGVGRTRAGEARIKLFRHTVNQGKGAALRTGFAQVSAPIVIIQDADLEYDPEEYHLLLKPILLGRAEVVFGSRFLGSGSHRVLYYWHSVGNRFLTTLSNMLTDLNLTDMETCYKVFTREVIQGMPIHENRFGFEPEITAHVSRLKVRIYEVAISYHGRTYAEGKKIGWRDGFSALRCILRYNLLRE